MTASTHFENCIKYCVYGVSIEQPIAKRAEVGPIVDIVDINFIEPEVRHSGRGTIIDHLDHIQQSKNLKFIRG